MMRNRHHYKQLAGRHSYFHLWDVVATLAAVMVHATHVAAAEDHIGGAGTTGPNDHYSPQFLTYVDQVIDDLVRVHNAFWTEGQWYNMTLKSENPIFGLFYDRPGAVQVITDPTDPTGIYGK